MSGPVLPSKPTRLGYLGSPALAIEPLRALHEAGFEIPLVVSRPDARRGRGSTLSPSPVKAAAIDLGLAVTDQIDDLLDPSLAIDLGVVVAFGRIIRPETLSRLAMVNLHLSLLPRWRGAAPIERAMLAGDAQTGACVMDVEEGLDTGGVHARSVVDIGDGETISELTERLIAAGSRLLVDSLRAGLGEPEPQVGEPVYAEKMAADDHRLDWTMSAEQVHRVVRLERAWTLFRGDRFRVHRAEVVDAPADADVSVGGLVGDVAMCGSGGLRLLEVQPAGRSRQPFDAWVNGARPTDEETLGS